MTLSQDLITDFAKLTNNEPKKDNGTFVNAVYRIVDGKGFVQIDGSNVLTPITATVDAKDGERVTVLVKDHTAIVTSNVTSPSITTGTIIDLKDQIDENGNSIKQINNTIEQYENSIIEINNNIQRNDNIVNQYKNLVDQQNNKIQEHNNQITSINNTITEQNNTINQHDNAINQQNNTISQQGNIISQQGNKIEEFDSNIQILNSGFIIKDGVITGLNKAVIDDLETNNLNTKYAQIDFSNIEMAAIEKLFTDSGIIKDLIVSDGKITGELVGVTIKGDLIEGNTVKADKLVVLGSDGLYYKLNVNSLGEAVASSDEKYQNGLDGSVLITKSVVAEKIAVDDLVAFGATIGGFHIGDHSLFSGVKSSIDNDTEGLYFGDDGQIAIGDGNNYIKYYEEDGERKLDIKASKITFGTNDDSLEDTISGLQESSTKFEQTEKDFNFIFNQLSKSIDDINNETNKQFLEYQKYIRFVDGNIVLGQIGNEITLTIKNNKISFLQNNEEVAYFSNNKLYITDASILNSLQIGNFAFKPRSNGSLSFRKNKKTY